MVVASITQKFPRIAAQTGLAPFNGSRLQALLPFSEMRHESEPGPGLQPPGTGLRSRHQFTHPCPPCVAMVSNARTAPLCHSSSLAAIKARNSARLISLTLIISFSAASRKSNKDSFSIARTSSTYGWYGPALSTNAS